MGLQGIKRFEARFFRHRFSKKNGRPLDITLRLEFLMLFYSIASFFFGLSVIETFLVR
jgi:hypothetical protein